MNNRERRTYWRKWSAYQIKQEARWFPRIFDALQGLNKQFINYAREHGLKEAMRVIDQVVTPMPLLPVMQTLYRTVGRSRAKSIAGEIKRDTAKLRTVGYNERLTRMILEYFRLNILNKSVIPITNTHKEFIRRAVAKGIQEGLGVEEIIRNIEDSPYTRSHARLVVRTETVRAANAGADLYAEQSDLLLDKEWISAHDARTRRPPRDRFDHWNVDGQIVPSSETFNVSGEQLRHPGDPAGSAGNVINCRCVVAYVVKRDANGRPMRKPKAPELFAVLGQRASAGATAASALVGAALGEIIGELITGN